MKATNYLGRRPDAQPVYPACRSPPIYATMHVPCQPAAPWPAQPAKPIDPARQRSKRICVILILVLTGLDVILSFHYRALLDRHADMHEQAIRGEMIFGAIVWFLIVCGGLFSESCHLMVFIIAMQLLGAACVTVSGIMLIVSSPAAAAIVMTLTLVCANVLALYPMVRFVGLVERDLGAQPS